MYTVKFIAIHAQEVWFQRGAQGLARAPLSPPPPSLCFMHNLPTYERNSSLSSPTTVDKSVNDINEEALDVLPPPSPV